MGEKMFVPKGAQHDHT